MAIYKELAQLVKEAALRNKQENITSQQTEKQGAEIVRVKLVKTEIKIEKVAASQK